MSGREGAARVTRVWQRRRCVRVLDQDEELGRDVHVSQLREAAAASVAETHILPAGSWLPEDAPYDEQGLGACRGWSERGGQDDEAYARTADDVCPNRRDGVVGDRNGRTATYEPGIGVLGHYTFETTPLSDRMEIRANVATGQPDGRVA